MVSGRVKAGKCKNRDFGEGNRMRNSSWQQIVAVTLSRYLCSRAARIIVRGSEEADPSAFLGELYLRIQRSTRCQQELPALPSDEIAKRIWVIARFHLLNAVRQERLSRGIELSGQLDLDCRIDGEERDDGKYEHIDFNLPAAVAELPEPLKSVVEHHLSARTFSDIAATEGIAVGTVSRRFQKAVKLLRGAASLN